MLKSDLREKLDDFRHSDFFALLLVALFGCVFFGVLFYLASLPAPGLEAIKNMDCYELKKHIADFGQSYESAEHRYKWLCVDSKVQQLP